MSTSDRAERASGGFYAGIDVGADRVHAVLIAPTRSADRASGAPATTPGAAPGPGTEICIDWVNLSGERPYGPDSRQVSRNETDFGSPARSWAVVGRLVGLVCEVAGFCRPAVRAGVDAPGGLSAGAHLADESVAPKFRRGRCSEVPVAGWPAVSWVTPSEPADVPGWMHTGFEVWRALEAEGVEAVETFPAACFHRINGGRWPPRKSTPRGRAARLALLAERLELPTDVDRTWTHDDIDAAACALVAAAGRPAHHQCPAPDGSVMWVID